MKKGAVAAHMLPDCYCARSIASYHSALSNRCCLLRRMLLMHMMQQQQHVVSGINTAAGVCCSPQNTQQPNYNQPTTHLQYASTARTNTHLPVVFRDAGMYCIVIIPKLNASGSHVCCTRLQNDATMCIDGE